MGTTTKFTIPYPELTDPPDGPGQMRALAEKVDTALTGSGFTCTSTTRPAPSPGAMIFETDTNRIMVGVTVSAVNYWVPLPGTKICNLQTNASPSIPHDSVTPVPFNIDTAGDPFDVWTSGSRIKPTFPGHYLFMGAIVYSSNATGYRQAAWYVNGSMAGVGCLFVIQPALASSGVGVVARPFTRWMNGTTDYVELMAYQNSGAAVTLSNSAGYQTNAIVTYHGAGKDASGG